MGFLGVGKTTAILDLLRQKLINENWAVLVNEFGSIGIDGAIYAVHGVKVKEVAGGCMCCIAGVPMQVAINSLLKEIRPDRLLIEPTGLGHPKKVLDILKGEGFATSLKLQVSFCLLDPNSLKNTQYTEHENFIDQIAMCDVLIANKMDLADEESLRLFDQLASSSSPAKQLVVKTQFGQLNKEWLDLDPVGERHAVYANHHHDLDKIDDGFHTLAWVYDEGTMFNLDRLKSSLNQLQLTRVKGIVKTDQGWMLINALADQITINTITEDQTPSTSCIEIIYQKLDKQYLEQQFKLSQEVSQSC